MRIPRELVAVIGEVFSEIPLKDSFGKVEKTISSLKPKYLVQKKDEQNATSS